MDEYFLGLVTGALIGFGLGVVAGFYLILPMARQSFRLWRDRKD